MTKYERIQKVRQYNLNTEDSILVTSTDELLELTEFCIKLEKVSIRTQHRTNEQVKTLHYPIVLLSELKPTLESIFSAGLEAIVAKPIDPADCELAGAIWKQECNYIVELAKGPGTTRRVTHDGIIDIKLDMMHNYVSDPRIVQMITEVSKIPLKNCMVEISYYENPVGWKNENIIIWEITKDGTKSEKSL